MVVIPMNERPGAKQARQLESRRALGIEIAQIAFGYAYDRVVREHPEAQTPSERHELAIQLALGSLPEGMKWLNDEVPRIDHYKLA